MVRSCEIYKTSNDFMYFSIDHNLLLKSVKASDKNRLAN